MAGNKPARAHGKGIPPPGENVVAESDSSPPVPPPDGSDFPTLVDSPDNAKVIPISSSERALSSSESPTLVDHAPTAVAAVPQQTSHSSSVLTPGMLVTQRYEILAVLGEGGMGAVYKAKDRELDRLVALKVIRPEFAANADILQRFKQEILLSSKVTHRNVVRIYDLGETPSFKFITMEYVDGTDLRHLLAERHKVPAEEAVSITQQVLSGLGAAHREGIIHRDLKPGNIMVDQQGRVVVMDFGLARSIASDGMTRTGLMVGTMEYMSPEQAQAKELDVRSDIFTLGLILYELLTGKMPYAADSAVASLLKRTQERAAPVSDHDAAIPRSLSSIVAKCLERDPKSRYQNTDEVLADLENWRGKRAAATLRFSDVTPWGRDIPWPTIGALAAVLAITAVGFVFRHKLFPPTASSISVAPSASLAILPFRNASAQPDLDWLGASLGDMLTTDIGQSPHLKTVPADRLHQILNDLQITGNVVIDPTMLSRIARFSSADIVVWGQYAKFGDQIRIDATFQDLKHDRRVPLKVDVANESEIPAAVDRLAESIRQNLGVSDEALKELRASSFQPSSKSMAALRDYSQGVSALRDGKSIAAQAQFEAATKEDPAFALAFAKLAQSYANLGYDGQAQQAAQTASTLSEDLPPGEKYLITAISAQVTHNYPQAISAYEALAKASPYDVDVEWALAKLYEDSGDLSKAKLYYDKLSEANPKDVAALVASGRIAIKNGDPQGSLDLLNRGVSLAAQLGNDEQRGTSLHLLGVAYRMLDKSDEALRNFQEALAIRKRTGDKRGIAYSVNEMAVVEESLGKAESARQHYEQALALRRDIGDKRGLVDTLLDLGSFLDARGDHEQGLKMYKEALQDARDIGNDGAQALCLNNIGSAYFSKGEYEDARTYFQQAIDLREKSNVPQDVVESVHNLAETSARMGQYDQAITQYMKALDLRRKLDDQRGGAIEAYSMGRLFSSQGRFGAAIDSEQDALKTLRNLKDRTFWMAEVLSGYAEALVLSGRGSEAQPFINEALAVSRELKNDGLVAQSLYFQGDVAYYAGDLNLARSSYQSALQAATHSKEPDKILIAKARLARLAVEQGRAAAEVGELRSLSRDAEQQGFAYVSVDCLVTLGDALYRSHDYGHAREELERALLRSENLGLKPLNVKAHYLLARVSQQQGNPTEAQQHYRAVRQLLDEMHTQPGADKVLDRADFKLMYSDSAHS